VCPRALLARSDVELLDVPETRALDNVNTVEQYAAATALIGSGGLPDAAHPQERRGVLRLHVRYFALLREQAGRSTEELETEALTPQQLYQQLQHRRGFTLEPQLLRVAVNDEFGDWHAPLADGDTVAFLPPVAGG
jgi:molybdopterin converting factor subunit 1